MPNYAKYINNRQNGAMYPKKASTVFQIGYFLAFDAAGHVRPVTNNQTTDKIVGLSNERVLATDADYTGTRDISVSEAIMVLDSLEIPISVGTADASIVGSKFDVNPSAPGSITLAAPGTQITVTKVINGSLVKGRISLSEFDY